MKIASALLLAAILVSLQGCVGKGTMISPLGKPEFLTQSPPDSVVETGIRQDPNTGGIFLQWYQTAGASGYEIFRSDTTDLNNNPIKFTMVLNVISSSALNDTSAVDGLAATGVRYYYYIVAVSSDGGHSVPSDTINYELIDRPTLTSPVNGTAVSSGSATFGWVNPNGGYTVIRVEDTSAEPPASVWVSRRFQTFALYPSYVYNFDSTATQQLVSGQTYQWRVERFDVDGTGRPYEGATSAWGSFTVN